MNKTSISKPVKADRILFRQARLVDPKSTFDKETDLVVIDGHIDAVGSVDPSGFDGQVIDASGKIIVPGLIDLHVHLREPGQENAETVISGCHAAMAGGFTAVCPMPNTHPVTDSRGHVEFLKERAQGQLVEVHPIASVTKEEKGQELTEMADLIDAGAVGFSDDGLPVKTTELLRRALEYAGLFGRPVIDHCEDMSLSEGGAMHEGVVSTQLGMRGIPSISETVCVARDLLIAEFTGGLLHIAHVSTAGAVALIRDAKKRGVRVTAETCPHYLVLTDEAVRSFDTNTKMKPPLRTETDRQALLEGLRDGTIDVIATDHAPHSIEKKETEYDAAAFGIVGLETALGICLTHLVDKKVLTFQELIQKMSVSPRAVVNLPPISITKGSVANLTVIDPDCDWVVQPAAFHSRSRNTPFDGWSLKGRSYGVLNQGLWCASVESISNIL